MDLIFEFSFYFFVTLIGFLSTFFLGVIINKYIFKLKINNTFIHLSIGLITSSLIIALCITQFKTFLIGLIPIYFFIFFKQKNKKIEINLQYRHIYIYIPILLFYFLLLSFSFVDFFENKKFVFSDSDYIFYAKIAKYLIETGIENFSLDYFLYDKRGLAPYHYTEIWYSSIYTFLFNINSIYSLNLISMTIFLTTIIIGIKEVFQINTILFYPFLIIFPFFLTFGWILNLEVFNLKASAPIWDISLFEHKKHFFIYLSLILGIFYIRRNEFIKFTFIICFGAFGYIIIAPSIFISATIILLYNLFLSKRINYNQFLSNMVLLIGVTIIIGLFYYCNSNNSDLGTGFSLDILIQYYTSFDTIKTIINIIGKTTVQSFIVLLPICCLIGVQILKENFIYLLYYSVFFFSSLLCYALTHQMRDGDQFWTAIFIPLTNILVFVSIYQISKNKKKILPSLILLLIPFCINKPYTNYSLKSIYKAPPIINKSTFVYLRTKNNYSQSIFSCLEQVYQGHLNSLSFFTDPLKITCLTTQYLPENTNEQKSIKKNTTFSLYTNNQKKENNFISYQQSQIDFINEFKIDYLLADTTEIPENLSVYFKKTSIVIDNYYLFERI